MDGAHRLLLTTTTTIQERQNTMILKHPITAGAIALAASATLALAAPPEGGQGDKQKHKSPRPHMAPPLVTALDTDKNREISAAEIANAGVALKALDKNNDSDVTREELMPRPPGEGRGPGKPDGEASQGGKNKNDGGEKPNRPRRPVPPLMQALDANKDGKLDTAELNNASSALRSLDKNSDGKLTPEEFMGRPPKGDGPGKGPKGPGAPESPET